MTSESSNARCHGELRIENRDKPLDISFAFVPRCSQQRLVIVGGQVRREQRDGRQCDVAVGEKFEDFWELPRGTRRRDPAVGCRFREM